MSIDMLRQKRRQKQLEKWVQWAMMAEAFFVALSPSLATVALMAGILLTVWKFRMEKKKEFRHLPYDVPIALFVVLSAASVLVSPDKGFSFYNYYHLVGVYVFTYLLIGQNVTNAEQVKKIVLSLGASAVFVLLYGFYQYVFGIDISDMKWVDGEAFPDLTKRVFSTWENPNILAGYLDAVLCILLGFFMKSGSKLQQAVLVLGMIVVAACLAMTYARGACLAVAFVFLLYGLFKDWRIILACLVIIGIAFWADPALYERISSVFTKMDTSAEMRLAFWEATVAMIQDHPFLGIGWGAYWMVYPEYDFYMQGAPIKIVHAHNIYLNYMAEIGIAGAIAFFWYFFGTMSMCLRSEFLSQAKTEDMVPEEGGVNRFLSLLHAGTVTPKVQEEAGSEPAVTQGNEKPKEAEKEAAVEAENKPDRDSAEEAPESKKETENGEPSQEDGSDSRESEASSTLHEGIEDSDARKKSETEEGKEDKEEDEEDKEDKTKEESDTTEHNETGNHERPALLKQEDDAEDGTEDEEIAKEEAKKSNEAEKKTAKVISLGEVRSKAKRKAVKEEEKEETEEDTPKEGAVKEDTVEEENEEEQENEEKQEKEKKEGEKAAEEGTEKKEEEGTEKETEEDDIEELQDEAEAEPSKGLDDYWQEVKTWEDRRVREGLSLGIGLAFISVAVNGMTDDLLFNIPTSMLLWMLAALAAVTAAIEDREDS